MKDHNLQSTKKLTDNKYLNLFKLEYENQDYFMASRKKNALDMAINNVGEDIKTDAVMIASVFSNGDILLIRQFRPAINDYIYEFPAGLVDEGEEIYDAAERELKEEVGLDIVNASLLLRPSYTSVGMSDESISIIIAEVSGELSTEGNESNEDIEPILLKVEDVEKFLNENRVGAKTGLILAFLSLLIKP